MEKQTAGRDALGAFAPKFAQLNDDVLFGEVWSREDKLCLRDRSLATVSALVAGGITDSSLRYHLETAKKNGVTKTEMSELLTHLAFYTGWPRAWAAFRMAAEVYEQAQTPSEGVPEAYARLIPFPIGTPNDGYAEYFSGRSYLAPLSVTGVSIFNVTFEPGCRNNWHVHRAQSGGGQILLCVGGRGYYQAEGEAARSLRPGDTVNIRAGVKHWHGAAPDSWFSHLAVEVPGENVSNEWLEPVTDEAYARL